MSRIIQIGKSQPAQGDVFVSAPLTNISVAYLQQQMKFVAGRVFPNVPVTKQAGSYFTFDRSFFMRDELKQRADGAESAGVGYAISTGTYFADVWAAHHDIGDQRRANSQNPLNEDRNATQLLTQLALIRREKQWVTDYFAASKWTGDQTGVDSGPGANQFLRWNDDASTPIEDIRAQIVVVEKRTGFTPNKLVLGKEVWNELVDHPDIVDRVKYGQTAGGPARVTREAVAALLEIDEVLVMSSIENTAAESLTASYGFIGGKSALLVYAAPNPALEMPSGGYTFSWTGLMGAAADGQRIKRFRMEANSADRVEIEIAFDMGLVSADLGVFFATAVA